MTMTDEALMRRFQAGDAAAFATLVERHQAHALHFCDRMLHDPDMAEDLAQEAFARILLRPGGWTGKARFTTYLFSILKNLCLDELRWRARWRTATPDTELPDPSATPEEALLVAERQGRVRGALARLSPEYLAALLLREYHDLTYLEIATVMGWSASKTKVTIFRARQALGRELADQEGGIPDAAR